MSSAKCSRCLLRRVVLVRGEPNDCRGLVVGIDRVYGKSILEREGQAVQVIGLTDKFAI